jgi:hypothetical protein
VSEDHLHEPARLPLWGISEWMCYHSNYDKPCRGPDEIDICVGLHAEAGFDHLVWNLGRSVVDYWSDLPHLTRMCEQGDRVGGASWAFVGQVMDAVCPLRRALASCAGTGMELWGRLGMNRHYGSDAYSGVTSRLALNNPHLRERSKSGKPVPSRLCYACDEVQQERIDILLEAHRIGVAGVVLDFCRQMPMLQYHEALVEPFRRDAGTDPRQIDAADPAAYEAWFQYRADVLTGFLGRLRRVMREQETDLGRACPILARIPDSGRWLMRAYGLDSERWCRDDLVDGLMLSPFPITREDLDLHPEEHVGVARLHGKRCIGGIGSKGLLENGVESNTGFYHEQPVHALAARQLDAGVEGLSLYQSETMLRMHYLRELWGSLPSPVEIRRRAACPAPEPEIAAAIGMDWHAHLRGRYGLRAADAGEGAL